MEQDLVQPIFCQEVWSLAAKRKIAPLNGDNGDWFGCSVSISDNYSVVGAYYDSDNGSFSGAAYVFYYNSSIWQNISKITPSGAASDDYFGNSVCFADDYAIIGSFGDSDNGNSSGSAYISVHHYQILSHIQTINLMFA